MALAKFQNRIMTLVIYFDVSNVGFFGVITTVVRLSRLQADTTREKDKEANKRLVYSLVLPGQGGVAVFLPILDP